jgi:ABC-type transport system involved in Fe-S cluster assembly fused permease/ATPase subunit
LGDKFQDIVDYLVDIERLLEIFQMRPTISDKKDAQPLKFSKGKVHFTSVSFGYRHRQNILKKINFEVPSGLTFAIVGEKGSGKSTLLKILLRFYDINDGKIEIDDQDIRDVTVERYGYMSNTVEILILAVG